MRKTFMAASWKLAFGLLVMAPLLQTAQAQEIHCDKAETPDIKTVCHDPYLRKLEAIRAALHADLAGYLKQRRKEKPGWAEHWETRLFESERGFARSRSECGADPACIATLYENHNRNLMRLWRDILR